MEVKAINSVSSLNFGQRSDKPKNKNVSQPDYPQMDAPSSRNAANAMRHLVMAAALLGATTMATGSLTSCDKWDDKSYSYSESKSESNSSAIAVGKSCCGCGKDTVVIHDTIKGDTVIKMEFVPVIIHNYPFHLADSLIQQGKNIGIPIEGPSTGDSLVFVGSFARNMYDNITYQTYATENLSDNTQYKLSTITKITNGYNEANPKVSWMRSTISDIKDEGIYIKREVCDSPLPPSADQEYKWKDAGYEIRTNGSNGKNNKISVFDKNGNLVYANKDYVRGMEAGTFELATVAYDRDGNVIYDEETGKPEMVYYDFDNAKIWAEKAQPIYK